MEENRKKEIIKAVASVAILLVLLVIVIIMMIKYSVEGEKNMPFQISKMTVVSTAEGIENENATEKWNMNIMQNNDIYFSIEKNKNAKEEDKIESIRLENIQITKEPQIGEIKIYMPNSVEGRTFSYEEQYIVENQTLTYQGGIRTDLKTLEIGNQGGNIAIRFSNVGLGTYVSDEEAEVKHDGTLVTKTGATMEDLQFEISFDFVIEMKNKSYRANMKLDLPCGNIIEQGTSSQEITDMSNYVFKR